MALKIKNKQLAIVSDFDINNNRLMNVDTPIDSLDAVNKDYLDTQITNSSLDYSTSNQDMLALSGTSGIYLATNTTITDIPATIVRVEINGLKVTVGSGTTNAHCFFSDDNGITAKNYDNITQGDSLYWNGDVATYQLEETDLIDFNYMVI